MTLRFRRLVVHGALGLVMVLFGWSLFRSASVHTLPTSSASTLDESTLIASDISPGYKWYSPETLATAQASGRTFLLFWVPWCSSCSALDQELEQRSAELPNNVTVLKVNMDKQSNLVSQYGIAIQHTIVEIDADGSEVQKWVGGDFNVFTTHL